MMLRLPHSALRLATRSSVATRSCIAPVARTCATRSCIAPAARTFATRSCCGSGIRIASVAALPPLAASAPALPVALCARIASHETTLEPPAAVAPPDKPATGATTDAADATGPSEVAAPPARPAARDAWSFFWKLLDLGLLLAGALLTLSSTAIAVAIPARAATLLRAASAGAVSWSALLRVIGAINAQALLKVAGSYCLLLASDRTKRRLKQLIFASMLDQDLGFIGESRAAAQLALSADTEKVQRALSHSLASLVSALGGICGSIAQLSRISTRLTALVLLLVPPIAFFASVAHRHERGMQRRTAAASAAATQHASTALGELLTVQAYGAEAREAAVYDDLVGAECALEQRALLFHKVWLAGFQLLTNGAMALCAAYAGQLASRGDLDAPSLLSFVQLSWKIGEGIGQLSFLSNDASKVADAIARLHALVVRTPAIPPLAGATIDTASPFLRGEVRLRDVDFTYPSRPEQPVLRGCSLTMRPGAVTALVGPSGGGKTTLAQLIGRWFEPDGGAVTLDGVDLRELQPRWLRGEVLGVVSQDPVLLPGTIRENIAYARPDASDAEVEAAARAANAHEFIAALHDGYDTVLAGDGGGLSVGQKQRVAIARALLKAPRVLLLDEPTSALDPNSEAAVQQALDRLVVGRTVLVIAHRLSTVKAADTIAVLLGGRIVEQGTHDELIAKNGAYAEMVRTQLRE